MICGGATFHLQPLSQYSLHPYHSLSYQPDFVNEITYPILTSYYRMARSEEQKSFQSSNAKATLITMSITKSSTSASTNGFLRLASTSPKKSSGLRLNPLQRKPPKPPQRLPQRMSPNPSNGRVQARGKSPRPLNSLLLPGINKVPLKSDPL